LASGYKSGGLISVLASGPSAYPNNARDLTLTKYEFCKRIYSQVANCGDRTIRLGYLWDNETQCSEAGGKAVRGRKK
jgi:hypothetical protein